MKADPHHPVANDFLLRAPAGRLVTSDYVLDETLTLFQARGAAALGVTLTGSILRGDVCRLERVGEADFAAAFATFAQFRDKGWSFTDCTSYVLMQRLGIREAFSFDRHFAQFGIVQVVPDAP